MGDPIFPLPSPPTGYGRRRTRILAIPTTLSELAAMTSVPLAWAVTRPALLTEAIASFEDDHVNALFGMAAPPERFWGTNLRRWDIRRTFW